jgi:predicted DNA-binding transcriptional regulator YafY
MRASRLVSLLLLLQTRGRMTAAEIGRELEVSVRTVYRDLDALSEAGVPVYAERGPGGGAQLVEGYRTRLTGLNADEAEALFLSGLPGPAAELGLGTVLAAAQLKVLAALPAELRGRASRVRQRFHLVVPGWFGEDDPLPTLPTVAEAVWGDRQLRIRYRRGDEITDRLVEPYGLVLKAGTWYLVARRDGSMRTYRVSRIVDAMVTEQPFERPADFDLATHWDAASAEFTGLMTRAAVTLRVAPDGLGVLSHAVGSSRVRAALDDAPPPDADGWRTLTLRLDSIDWAHDDLLAAGARIEVLAPAELRARMAETARAMAARYRETEPPHPGRRTRAASAKDGGADAETLVEAASSG